MILPIELIAPMAIMGRVAGAEGPANGWTNRWRLAPPAGFYRGISAERLSASMAKETAASMVRAAAMPTTTTIKNVRMTLPPFPRL
ncbi:MAG: hypothetical protein ACREC2_09010 [Bradyrhizobium sp.]